MDDDRTSPRWFELKIAQSENSPNRPSRGEGRTLYPASQVRNNVYKRCALTIRTAAIQNNDQEFKSALRRVAERSEGSPPPELPNFRKIFPLLCSFVNTRRVIPLVNEHDCQNCKCKNDTAKFGHTQSHRESDRLLRALESFAHCRVHLLALAFGNAQRFPISALPVLGDENNLSGVIGEVPGGAVKRL